MAAPKQKTLHSTGYYRGEPISPCKYYGKSVGHGNFLAALDKAGNLIRGEDGIPLKYRSIKSIRP